MRLWLDPGRLAARQITAGDVVNALREQNVQVAAGSIGEAPARENQTYQISVRAAGRLQEASEFENIVVKAGREGSLVRLRDVGPDRARRRGLFLAAPVSGDRRRRSRRDAAARPRTRSTSRRRSSRSSSGCAQNFPPGVEYRVAFNTTTVVRESITRGADDARRGDRARRARHVPVPPELAQHAHPDDHDPGVARRGVRVREAHRLLDQHADALRHHPRDGHRRGRCDRRHREHRAAHPGVREEREAGRIGRDGRGLRRRHRDGARADRGVRAGGVLSRNDRPPLCSSSR